MKDKWKDSLWYEALIEAKRTKGLIVLEAFGLVVALCAACALFSLLGAAVGGQ